jgi:gamma-glutamylcyclotransferase (GGCT)/AIG2-like uncharacterized protein YtfP
MRHYFAYGSNLNQRGFARRCPAAVPVGPAVLKDYKLCFRRYADISPHPGAQVAGALWRIAPAGLRALDAYEGEDYRQVVVRVVCGGTEVEAIAYMMHAPGPLAPPELAYYREIVVGYRDWGLDEAPLRRARYDTLNVGPAAAHRTSASERTPPRRAALWDPALNATGTVEALIAPRGFSPKRRD